MEFDQQCQRCRAAGHARAGGRLGHFVDDDFQRSTMLRHAKRGLDSFEERFWSGIDLSKLYRQVGSSPDPDSGLEQIFRAGFKEFSRLRQQSGFDPDAVMDGVNRAMRVAISREEEKLEQSLPFLATVGSTSPYVGLFGTVWGIMNSFRGLGAGAAGHTGDGCSRHCRGLDCHGHRPVCRNSGSDCL